MKEGREMIDERGMADDGGREMIEERDSLKAGFFHNLNESMPHRRWKQLMRSYDMSLACIFDAL